MSYPIAKQGDIVVGLDTHVIQLSSPGGPVPTPMPLPFSGPLARDLSPTVFLDSAPVAVVGSGADNSPPHIPIGGPFQKSPSNQGTVTSGSPSVFVDNKAVARATDSVKCCNDPGDSDTGHIVVTASTGQAE